ncbi:MAG: hypothetical protein IJ617_08535 [Oscillospiraceae bacterium]|nr:hypothetical protein [Oscillospiraceae bacterium]
MRFPGKFKKRTAMTTVGVVLCALSVGLFKCSEFGVDPFQCFAQGLWGRFFATRVSYGTYYMLLSALLLAVDLAAARRYIGAATFINMFLTGYIVDAAAAGLNRAFPAPSLPLRLGFLLAGVVLMCFASSLYMTSNLGVSVYDAIPILIAEKTALPFRFVRVGCDLVCVGIGALSGLLPGPGTLITALFMGPLIDFFNRRFSIPLLEREKR